MKILTFSILFSLLISFNIQSQDDENIWQLVGMDMFEQQLDFPGAVVLDVRYLDDYVYDRIPNAISVHSKEILTKQIQSFDTEQYILVYGHFTSRCIAVSDILVENGFVNIFILNTSFDDWVGEGRKTEKRKLKRKEIKELR